MLWLENLGPLHVAMKANDIYLVPFKFTFNKNTYICMLYRFGPQLEKRDAVALLHADIYRNYDSKDCINVELNRRGFLCRDDVIYKFFKIYGDGKEGFSIFNFCKFFNNRLPEGAKIYLEKEEISFVMKIVDAKDTDSANKQYCYAVKKHDNNRSVYNSAKTMMIRPSLYDIFKSEPHISFLYTDDPEKEKNDKYIWSRYVELHGSR